MTRVFNTNVKQKNQIIMSASLTKAEKTIYWFLHGVKADNFPQHLNRVAVQIISDG
jgi:hypothetical protein